MRSRCLVWVTPTQIREIENGEQLPDDFGAKARGLAWLPAPWVPAFFVLSPEFHRLFISTPAKDRRLLLKGWAATIDRAVREAGLEKSEVLYLRSNAVSETLIERGKFRSFKCRRNELVRYLDKLFKAATAADPNIVIGAIVQRFVAPVLHGHLSNQRRVAEEYRDAIVEATVESTGAIVTEALSYRRWRRPSGPDVDALVCRGSSAVPQVLREPLAYAAMHSRRVLYEWVWDGQCVYVVQADQEIEKNDGVSPQVVLKKPLVAGEVRSLRRFRIATKEDAAHWNKLKNHFLYRQNGFSQPQLFVLDEKAVISNLLRGKVDEQLSKDLKDLTVRPIVIRTSCPKGGKTFLPRSDELFNVEQAVEWLMGRFREEVQHLKLGADKIALVAHHYIPALGAAFSSGAPDSREVYVEALWGIPEGIYYYPCDVYLVDTGEIDSEKLQEGTKRKFSSEEFVRFKGRFVAPNDTGKFVVYKTAVPWDWKNTISDKSVLANIAFFTRKLAALEGRRVKVMWFLQCAAWTGLPAALPWYHDFEAGAISDRQKGYQRNARDEIFDLRTHDDLLSLEAKAKARYKPPQNGKLVISLNPVEDKIIRDENFAKRVGRAAHRLGGIVELNGGILSHAYYALQRAGATVSPRNGAGRSRSALSFDKLVRDRVPDSVVAKGETVKVARLTRDQLKSALKIKLVEEAFEARDAKSEDLVDELADILEVVAALRSAANISPSSLENARKKKHRQRGGFEKGLVLMETSLQQASSEEGLLPQSSEGGRGRIVRANVSPALENVRIGPADARRGDEFVELVNSANVDLSQHEWKISAPRPIKIDASGPTDVIEWTLEGKREGAKMRLRLKIRFGKPQLEFPFSDPTGARKDSDG